MVDDDLKVFVAALPRYVWIEIASGQRWAAVNVYWLFALDPLFAMPPNSPSYVID
jgi:hypothetical protein